VRCEFQNDAAVKAHMQKLGVDRETVRANGDGKKKSGWLELRTEPRVRLW